MTRLKQATPINPLQSRPIHDYISAITNPLDGTDLHNALRVRCQAALDAMTAATAESLDFRRLLARTIFDILVPQIAEIEDRTGLARVAPCPRPIGRDPRANALRTH